MEYFGPWFTTKYPGLGDELRRELPPGHILAGLPAGARACRQDRDDVLFEVLDGSGRLALVHFSHQAKSDPCWLAPRSFQPKPIGS